MTVGRRNSQFLPDRGPVKYQVTLLLFLVARPVERDEGEAVESARERILENWRRERKKSVGTLGGKLHNYWQQGENEEEEEEEEDEDEDEEEFLEGSQS